MDVSGMDAVVKIKKRGMNYGIQTSAVTRRISGNT